MVANPVVFGSIFLLVGAILVLVALELITALRHLLYRLTGSDWIAPVDVKYGHSKTIPPNQNRKADDGN